MLDIRELINLHSKTDVKYVRKALREFAKVLEMPEIWEDVKKNLRK
jgi:hypothetical protein